MGTCRHCQIAPRTWGLAAIAEEDEGEEDEEDGGKEEEGDIAEEDEPSKRTIARRDNGR